MPRLAVEIQGEVAPGFEPVREAFAENFARRKEVGASLCVLHQGQVVVDLWGGVTAKKKGQPWQADTRVIVWSCTKGLTSLAFLMLAARGKADLDAPIASWWPEFAQGGKERVTLRMALNHTSGLLAIDDRITFADFADPQRIEQAVLATTPEWEPGTGQGYGAIAWGVISGALFRRLAGESLGTFLQREVLGPLKVEISLGQALPPEQVATLYPFGRRETVRYVVPAAMWGGEPERSVFRDVALRPKSPTGRSLRSNPSMGRAGLARMNDRELHTLELPWCGALASARGLARLYAPLCADGSFEGTRLVPAEALKPVHARQTWREHDSVLHKPIGWSQGFCKEPDNLFCPNTESFGHAGLGGALGLADPVAGVAIGYVMNRLDYRVRSPRSVSLCHAIYKSLGTPMDHNPILEQGA